MSKVLNILIGLPASGKSTWRLQTIDPDRTLVCSTDDIIDAAARQLGCTYNEAFPKVIDDANAIFLDKFKRGLNAGVPIIIDRTNCSKKSREKYIIMALKKGYTVTALEYARPMTQAAHDEWNRRLDNRPGKVIPNNTLQDMFRSFQPADYDEGFSVIHRFDTFKAFHAR